MRRIYLDHAATSPLLPEAKDAMVRWLDSANASTLYSEGRAAKAAIDEARETVSTALGCRFAEVIFTSGATESATLAIVGAAMAARWGSRKRILLSAAEHHCVLNTRELLEALGFKVEFLPVDRFARPQMDVLADSLAEDVLLVCAMHVNNELGSISPISEIAEITHRHGALLFADCVQTFGKWDWSVDDLGLDLASVSAHKIGGPKGAGALYIRAGTKVKPIHSGGGQERELRAGTENVASIAGFGGAVRHFAWDKNSISQLRNGLLKGLVELGAIPTLESNISVLDGHAYVRFPGLSAETLLIVLDRLGVSAGSGAACSSGSIEPSHVLAACGYSADQSKEGVRFTLGTETKPADIAEASSRIAAALDQIASYATH